MSAYDAVLFDLDGTLSVGDQDEAALYRAAFDHAGVDRFGSPAELWGSLDGPPDPDDRRSYLAAGFRRLGAKHGRREVPADALARGLDEAVDHRAVSLRTGAAATLDAAAAAGPVAVVTNGPADRQRAKVDALGLWEWLDAVVYGGDLPRRKPHPDPFETALKRLEPAVEDALYVGNSLGYDVAGAHAAGLDAAWCPQERDDSDDATGDDADGGDDEAVDGTDTAPDPGAYSPDYVASTPAELSELF
ncbi:MAG: HAD family hydrolase [Halolamina sp.]